MKSNQNQKLNGNINNSFHQTTKDRKERFNLPILFAGIILTVIIAILFVESAKAINFNRKGVKNVIQFDESGHSEGAVTIELSKRLGQRFNWDTAAISGDTEGEFSASVIDIKINNASSDTITDWNLRFSIPKHCYIGNAITGNVEIHQVPTDGKSEVLVQEINFEKMTHERMILKHILDDGKILVELNKGDCFVYTPSLGMDQTIEPTTITSVGGNEKQISFVIYTSKNIDPADVLKSATMSYSLRRDYLKQNNFLYLAIIAVVWALAFLLIYLFERRKERISKALELEEHVFETTIQAFSRIIDDAGVVKGHSIRSAKAAKAMAEAMGYNKKRAQNVYYAAKLHDCGMALVPDNILLKKDKLTFEEYEEVKKHPSKSFEAIRSITDIPEAATAARYHHERFDGTGYPEGRKGTDIPEVARMIAVIDAYDSMANNSLYHEKMSADDMKRELTKNKGTQFDPAMVDLFIKLLEDGTIVMEEDYE